MAFAYQRSQFIVEEPLDDPMVPERTEIGYSEWGGLVKFFWIAFFMGHFCLLFLVLPTLPDDFPLGGILLAALPYLGLCIWFGYRGVKAFRRHEPFIVLTPEGIALKEEGFFSWAEVEHEHTKKEGYGRHTAYYLIFWRGAYKVKLEISEYNTDIRRLKHLMEVYRHRHDKRVSAQTS